MNSIIKNDKNSNLIIKIRGYIIFKLTVKLAQVWVQLEEGRGLVKREEREERGCVWYNEKREMSHLVLGKGETSCALLGKGETSCAW